MHNEAHILLLLYTFITSKKKKRHFTSERALLRGRRYTASAMKTHCFGHENPLLREWTSVRVKLNHSLQRITHNSTYFVAKG